MRPQVLMDQGHARLHYAVPIAMERAGILSLAFCDYFRRDDAFDAWTNRALRMFSPSLADKMHDRHSDDLPGDKVFAERFWTLRQYWKKRVFKEDAGRFWDRWAEHRSKAIARRLDRGNALHGYITSLHPPLLKQGNAAGLLCTGDQIIAPVLEQRRQAELQAERFPGYVKPGRASDLSRFEDLEQATWPELSAISCPADYVKRLLVKAGVPEAKVSVLPYPFDVSHAERERDYDRPGPLVVGCVGAVNLRKGAPYFVEVAKRLASSHGGRGFEFRMIGPVLLADSAVSDAKCVVDFVGGVPRSQVKQALRDMDVFFFPSTCEGSAGALYEAASMALPIVTSPNSGTHLEAPGEALVRAYDDIDGYCEDLTRLAEDAALREGLGQSAYRALSRCSLDAYAQNILSFYTRAFAERGASS